MTTFEARPNTVSPLEGTHDNVVPEAHVRHRLQMRDFVLNDAEGWQQEYLAHLDSLWQKWNAEYFDGRLLTPYIMLTGPDSRTAYGDFSPVSSFGGTSQVRLRESILTGQHRCMRSEPEFAEGRRRFVDDVMLHETIHLWQQEVTGDPEDSYKGHGPDYRDKCNEIGKKMGLPPVYYKHEIEKDKSLPSCAHWPHCVRPTDYYLGAFVPTNRDKKKQQKPTALEKLQAAIREYLKSESPEDLGSGVASVLNDREEEDTRDFVFGFNEALGEERYIALIETVEMIYDCAITEDFTDIKSRDDAVNVKVSQNMACVLLLAMEAADDEGMSLDRYLNVELQSAIRHSKQKGQEAGQ